MSNLLKMGHVVTVWNRTAEKVLISSVINETKTDEGSVIEGWDY